MSKHKPDSLPETTDGIDAAVGEQAWDPFTGIPARTQMEPKLGVVKPRFGRKGIVGLVSAISGRTEVDKKTNWDIWSFRLETYDENGNLRQPVPVEMRGTRFDGVIQQGDIIEIPTKFHEGRPVRVDKVFDHTTQTLIQAKGKSHLLDIVRLVILLLFIIACILLVTSGR